LLCERAEAEGLTIAQYVESHARADQQADVFSGYPNSTQRDIEFT